MMWSTFFFDVEHNGLTWYQQREISRVLEYELGARCYTYTPQGVPRFAIDCRTPLDFAKAWARLAIVDGVSKLENLPITAQCVAVGFEIVRE